MAIGTDAAKADAAHGWPNDTGHLKSYSGKHPMTYNLDRDGLSACPDDPLRTAPPDDFIELCPELLWHGLVTAIKSERPFMGKDHTWWQGLITDMVYEHCTHLVDNDVLKEYQK